MKRIHVKILFGFMIMWLAGGGLRAQDGDDCNCEFTFDSSVQEAAGSRYRKVGLTGLPLSDEKPQAKDETDQAKEETYIDALTHSLNHSVTDVYVPLGASDLALSIRRNLTPEVWNLASGMDPTYQRPDRPFGLGWTSNLTPNIDFVSVPIQINTNPDCPGALPTPNYAIVTDDSGQTYRFIILYTTSGQSYYPLPMGRQEQEVRATTLVRYVDGSGVVTWEFTKKFGTKLVFGGTTLTRVVPSNKLHPDLNNAEVHAWARLNSVTDRYATTVSYSYASNNTLIPSSISSRGKSITIVPTADGLRVASIQDPRGYQTSFEYETMGTVVPVNLLSKVTHGDGGKVSYGWEIAHELDSTPRDPENTDPWNMYSFLDVTRISDPIANALASPEARDARSYRFSYAFDHSRRNYHAGENNAGYYIAPGNPRNVKQVIMAAGTTNLLNESLIYVSVTGAPPTLQGTRKMSVTDAEGNKRSWTFGGSQMIAANEFDIYISHMDDPRQSPWMVLYSSMTLALPGGKSEVFNFNAEAGMEISSVTDINGNITSYVYGDDIPRPTGFPIDVTMPPAKYGDPTSQTNALADVKTFTYDSKWRMLKTMVDEAGRRTEYVVDTPYGRRTSEKIYSAANVLVQESAFQYSTTYPGFMTEKRVKNLAGNPSWATDLVTTYVPDSSGNVYTETVTAADVISPFTVRTLTTTYTYDANNNKKSVTDPRNKLTSFTYDGMNRLTRVDYPGQVYKTIEYDLSGNKKREVDENLHVTRYAYDTMNWLQAQTRELTGGLEATTQFTYNAVGSKKTLTDPRSHVTTYDYDELQRVETITDAKLQVTTLVYGANSGSSTFDSSSFKPTTSTDPRGIVTTVVYDDLYRPTSTTVAYAAGQQSATSTVYDKVGNPVTETDPLNHATTKEYDALNRLSKVIYIDNSREEYFYTSTGLQWKASQFLPGQGTTLRATETEYDGAGRPVRVTAPPDNLGVRGQTLTVYDLSGNVSKTVNALGKTWDYVYDGRNRKTTETQPPIDGVQGQILWGYDNVGNNTSVTDARGNTTDTTYDAANRVVEVKAPLVNGARPTTTTEYDLSGNVKKVTDPNLHETNNTYDELNRLVTSTDAKLIVVTNEYDEIGNRTAVIDGEGNRTEFEYDGLNRNTKIIDDATRSTVFAYNALNKTSRTDSIGNITNYTYDSRNRLQTVTYVGRTQDNRTYSYDYFGNLLGVLEPGKGTKANVAYSYDHLNRVLTETSQTMTHIYTYDLVGNRLTVQYGGTSRLLASIYDALNRLKSLTDNNRITSYTYDKNGNVKTKTLPNGELITNTYDVLNRRTNINNTKYNFAQTYDPVGNVLTVTETYASNTTQNRVVTNEYDEINRLESETVTGANAKVTSYVYDDAHNRTVQVAGGVTTNLVYNNLNQLTTATTGSQVVTFGYDYNGNRTSRTIGSAVASYSYDYENRLVGLTQGGVTYNYVYDYRTRRVERKEGTVTTNIVFSGGTSVIEAIGATLSVEYVRGSDYGGGVGGILYSLRSGVPGYTHFNSRGDVVAKTNTAGNGTYFAAYQAFGKRTVEQGTTLDRQKANTKEEDPTGLLNEGMRYRDLETGVFITRDPAGMVDGPNLYTYVRQNPWTSFDPEGLFLFGLYDSAGDYAKDVGTSLGGIGSGAYGAVRSAVVGAVHSVASLPSNVSGIATSISEMSSDPGLYLRSAGDLAKQAPGAALQGANNFAAKTADTVMNGTLEEKSQMVGNGLANAGMIVAPFSKGGAVAEAGVATEATEIGTSAMQTAAKTKQAVSEATGLETRGTKVPGGRKIADTVPKGITDVKNAKGEVFKSVHTPPSKPHAGMAEHTHPNFRNTLPDGSVRSGVSKSAEKITRKDVIDATRENAQRTGE